mgnify:CR=1 FL=1
MTATEELPNLYLAGMIGSGNTTLGQIIARRLSRPFIDYDWELEKETGLDLHSLIRERGWLEFREHEYTTIKRLSQQRGLVVGLGGGTVRYEWNRDLLRGTGPVVLLTADLEVLSARVRANDRPRVNTEMTLEEELQWMWDQGREKYLAAADEVYDTGRGLSPDQEAEQIIVLVEKFF